MEWHHVPIKSLLLQSNDDYKNSRQPSRASASEVHWHSNGITKKNGAKALKLKRVGNNALHHFSVCTHAHNQKNARRYQSIFVRVRIAYPAKMF